MGKQVLRYSPRKSTYFCPQPNRAALPKRFPDLSAPFFCEPPESYRPSASAASADAPLCFATSPSTPLLSQAVPVRLQDYRP